MERIPYIKTWDFIAFKKKKITTTPQLKEQTQFLIFFP